MFKWAYEEKMYHRGKLWCCEYRNGNRTVKICAATKKELYEKVRSLKREIYDALYNYKGVKHDEKT